MSDASDVVLEVRGLAKTFRIGFFRKKVEAVRGIDFEVRRGEIFGLLGPNGAGKTTTLKMILRLISPMTGDITLFGQGAPGVKTMGRVGYVPENPYVYQYLRPHEFLDLCGRLFGMSRAERRERADRMIARVGLSHAVDRPIGKFSKGMMQRIGLAQALLHDPELLILDEPMSGLDPVGRKEVRDLVLEQRRLGKTIVFTSHILSDVELLCDRVGIMRQGRMQHYGTLDSLLQRGRRTEIVLEGVDDALRESLRGRVASLDAIDDRVTLHVDGAPPSDLIRDALEAGARLASVTPARETLEDLFVRDAIEPGAPASTPAPDPEEE